MKKHILISSIVRNRESKLVNYFVQIEDFIEKLKDQFEFSISIYENDSTDFSKKILNSYNYSSFKEAFIKTEDIGSPYFGSVTDPERVKNFAKARNKTIEGIDLSKYSNILIIEPDIIYNFETAKEIISRSKAPKNTDVYSGILITEGRPYDIWGMRRTSEEEWGWVFSDYQTKPVTEFWTTANGICLYNIEPFLKGLKFSAFNARLQKYDCDTAVLCEDFREMGYSKIIVNQSIFSYHE